LLEIRIHGRGGQGAVVASRLLGLAFFKEGMWVQSFPTFGAERRGAPVAAFTRVSEKPITLRCNITSPDILLVLDHTLLKDIDVTLGLKKRGKAIINSPCPVDLGEMHEAFWIDASSLALKHGLGSPTYPLVNTAMVGAFSGATGLISIDSVEKAIREYIRSKTYENILAAKEAYKIVRKAK